MQFVPCLVEALQIYKLEDNYLMALSDGPEQLVRLNHYFYFDNPGQRYLPTAWVKLADLATLLFEQREENPTCNTSTKTPDPDSQSSSSEAGASATATQQQSGE